MNLDFSRARVLKRFPKLDAFRGLACIGVVAMHCHLDYAMPWFPHPISGKPRRFP